MANTEMIVAWEVADLSAEAKIVRTVLGGTIGWMSYPDIRPFITQEQIALSEQGQDLILKALDELVSKDWALETTTDGARCWTGSRPEGVY